MVSLPATISPVSEHGVVAFAIGDEAAGLAHQQDAGRHVPRRQVALPVDVEPSGGDPGEVERRGAEAAQAGDLLLDQRELAEELREVAAAEMRQAAGDNRRRPSRCAAPRRAGAGR